MSPHISPNTSPIMSTPNTHPMIPMSTSTLTHNTFDHHKLQVTINSVKHILNNNTTSPRQRYTSPDTTSTLNNHTINPSIFSSSFTFLVRYIPTYIINHILFLQILSIYFKKIYFSCIDIFSLKLFCLIIKTSICL